MNKFQNDLMRYSKLSGAFEYAAKRVLADKNNTLLRQARLVEDFKQMSGLNN